MSFRFGDAPGQSTSSAWASTRPGRRPARPSRRSAEKEAARRDPGPHGQGAQADRLATRGPCSSPRERTSS
ncbi:MAG: hypothetical protein MZV64_33910 [Ignavibacteriales bacterium]|nr:hypothetical protein [Ignavibacteriales bacterium]